MILGKIGNHLSAGNWPSVLVELLVVIVGVYGAFQLENWGEDFRENQRERMLLEQLHSEIQFTYPLMKEQAESKKLLVNGALQVAAMLMQETGSGDLDTEQCEVIFSISILASYPLSLTTLDEMVNSGVHSQLDDRELSSLLFSLTSDKNYLSTYIQLVRSQQNILMDLYPDLIPRGVDANGKELIHCNTDGMRASQAFINHLISNIGRYRGLVGRLDEQLNALQEIHIKLDEVLGNEDTALHEDKADK